MTIGFFTDSYYPFLDGVATSVEACAKALEKRGHKVYVIAPKHPKHSDKEKNIYRLTSIKFLTSEARLALQLPERSLIKALRADFDIIHGTAGGGVTFIGLQISKARNIPYVATYHTLWNRYTHYFLKGRVVKPRMMEASSRIFGNLCNALIAPTGSVKKELLSYGIRTPITVIPSGLYLEKFKNVERGYLRRKLKIDSDKKVLLYVGRLGKEKSIDFIVKSFKKIYKKNENTVLVIVGEGPEKNLLKSLSINLKISDRVFFMGGVSSSNIPKVYSDSDIFVFASQTETQGMVVLEALASGLPVVVVNDDVFTGMVHSGRNGYKVKKDENVFAQKIFTILNDSKKYEKFSEYAENSVKKYSVEIMAEKLEKFYEDIVGKHKRRKKIIISKKYLQTFIYKFWDQIKNYQ